MDRQFTKRTNGHGRTIEQSVRDAYKEGWISVANIANLTGVKPSVVREILKDKNIVE